VPSISRHQDAKPNALDFVNDVIESLRVFGTFSTFVAVAPSYRFPRLLLACFRKRIIDWNEAALATSNLQFKTDSADLSADSGAQDTSPSLDFLVINAYQCLKLL
jgi:hypothetical protein